MSTSSPSVPSMTETSHTLAAAPGTPSILVTGASGNLGREVAARLRERGARVRGFGRHPGDARNEMEWVLGDITDPDAFRAALTGIDAVFLTWPLLDAAPAAAMLTELSVKTPRVVYLSSSAVDDSRVRQTDPIVQVHADMEALLDAAGVRPVVLRSETLASNVRGWAAQLRAGDVVAGPDIARAAVVDERDVAEAAVAVLLVPDDRFGCGPHVLTGPQILDRTEQVTQLAGELGRDLRFDAVPADRARMRMLADGRPEALVEALVAASVHRAESTHITDTVQRLTGKPAGTFAQWAADRAHEFTDR